MFQQFYLTLLPRIFNLDIKWKYTAVPRHNGRSHKCPALKLLCLCRSARRLQEATFEASLAGEGVMELLCMHYGRVLLDALGPISESEAKLKEAEKAEDEARRLCAPGPTPLCCGPYCHRPLSLGACMPCIRWSMHQVVRQ